jgi:hypothetical protein
MQNKKRQLILSRCDGARHYDKSLRMLKNLHGQQEDFHIV